MVRTTISASETRTGDRLSVSRHGRQRNRASAQLLVLRDNHRLPDKPTASGRRCDPGPRHLHALALRTISPGQRDDADAGKKTGTGGRGRARDGNHNGGGCRRCAGHHTEQLTDQATLAEPNLKSQEVTAPREVRRISRLTAAQPGWNLASALRKQGRGHCRRERTPLPNPVPRRLPLSPQSSVSSAATRRSRWLSIAMANIAKRAVSLSQQSVNAGFTQCAALPARHSDVART